MQNSHFLNLIPAKNLFDYREGRDHVSKKKSTWTIVDQMRVDLIVGGQKVWMENCKRQFFFL